MELVTFWTVYASITKNIQFESNLENPQIIELTTKKWASYTPVKNIITWIHNYKSNGESKIAS